MSAATSPRFLRFMGVLFLLPLPTFGTTLLVFKSKSRVVVAADSAVSRGGAIKSHVCKVVVTRDLVFAASGAYFPDQGLDIFALARRASIVGGNLAKKSGAYTAYVLPALEKFLDWQKTADPVSYSRFREIGASEVVFVDRHSLEVIHLWFPLDASGKPHAKTLDDWDQPLSGDDWRMQPVGQADEIFKAVEANPQWWRTPEKSLDRFLQLETTAKPLDVGPPFSSIRLDGSGAHWINKGACK